MALTLAYTWEFAAECTPYYFEDTTANYGAGENPAAAAITSTVITVTDSNGNMWTYSDYLPTQGEVELLYANFVPDLVDEDDTTDCGTCGSTTTTTPTDFVDGCYTINYSVYQDGTLVASTGQTIFFYCNVRNDIFDLILGSCDDCCDTAKQKAISDLRDRYDRLLISFNKLGCSACVTGMLSQLQKKIIKVEDDCINC